MASTQVRNDNCFFRLFLVPGLSIFMVFLIVLWMNNGIISRSNYWSFQIDWFINVNAFLSQYPKFWLNVTLLGDALLLFPILSFLMIWKPRAWAALFGAVPFATFFSIGGKELLAIPRPGAVLDHNTFIIIGDTLTMQNSLPSGHTITIFTAVTAIIGVYLTSRKTHRYIPWISIGLIIAACLSISRVAVGAHWPLDIVVGAALGYTAGICGVILTKRYQAWWHWLTLDKYQHIFGGIMFLWSINILLEAIQTSPQAFSVLWLSGLFGFVVSNYVLSKWFFVTKNKNLHSKDSAHLFKSNHVNQQLK